jgi:hypothetical protein
VYGYNDWLSRFCAYKATLFQAIAEFQSLAKWHFVSPYAVFTGDPEEPNDCYLRIGDILPDLEMLYFLFCSPKRSLGNEEIL